MKAHGGRDQDLDGRYGGEDLHLAETTSSAGDPISVSSLSTSPPSREREVV
eukprot:CAMPEP_0181199034 /NCGR_PEP_ID=MMETSP1096-20121128/16958_1 /TAXON_ID=156174 ORGANISM="Chrysochromulina ericina, Strain CCMP281" /NCGR_SAMPLE_ID=MMETSP1096 /ASSEMBLY_ACC=CAM_ASM_000453 /LENGTH=50 /DNA_ID=CAMNT_0023289183 /DNA_START=444 /DNA_END=596 /DNA_ORIENTATION=-